MSDLHELSVAEQLEVLRGGDVSARELTEHYLERIDRLDGEVGAFVNVTEDIARQEADVADRRLASGERQPLLGLPFAIKDLYPAAGAPTTFGCAAVGEITTPVDAWTVRCLRRAGVVLVGKTNTAELGATCFTHNNVTSRPTVTPYGLGCYASGSSGGAAAAVAAGMLPAGHAGDGAGSTRTPAATCYLVGVKPSRGLVTSSVPLTSLSSTTIEGPIARTVEDAALLLDVMAQPWSGDLYGWRQDQPFVEAIRSRPRRRLRVAMWTDTGLEEVQPHPEAVTAVERTARLLEELGHELHEISVPAAYDPPVRRALHTWFAAAVNASVSSLIPPERRDLLLPYTRYLHEEGELLSGGDVLAAQGVLAQFASAHLAASDAFDVALTPTASGPPVPVGTFLAAGVQGVADLMLGWSCYTPWANLTGQPAISLPSHLDGDGLPYGVQIVGAPRKDAELLALAEQLERAGLWTVAHPPCWNQ